MSVNSAFSGQPLRVFLIFVSVLVLTGCATSRAERDYQTRSYQSKDVLRSASEDGDRPTKIDVPGTDQEDGSEKRARSALTRVPSLADGIAASDGDGDQRALAFSKSEIEARGPPLELPMFIDVTFGEYLGVPYVTGPGVANKNDIVQLRSSGTIPAETFLNLVRVALADYGVRISLTDGVYQIVEDTALRDQRPRFIRSRTRPTTPVSLRPIVQFVELNAVSARDMASILRQAFGSRTDNLQFEADNESNYIVLSGLPEDVDAALSVIYEMDELQYAGTQVQKYAPSHWSVTDLSLEITRIMTAEGWQISAREDQPRPILVLPIAYSNDLLIFSRSREARARVNYWLLQLDRPIQSGGAPQVFVYNVKNLDASILAETANQVLAGGNVRDPVSGVRNQNRIAQANAQTGPNGGIGGATTGDFVVDRLGNRLIFTGTSSEYERVLPMLTQLDVPPSEVLIEVMIAQVTLTDSTSFGVDWTIRNLVDSNAQRSFNSFTDEGSELSGLISSGTFGPAGLAFGVLSPDVNVSIDALAENNQVNILSTPRLVARSGRSANVQVGTDVPIITTQRAAPNQTGAGDLLDTLQSIEYRSTGIILNIEPIVFSDDRIDLTINQEVSSTSAPSAGAIPSPTINNTSVSTLLSLQDGATAVIGGLIQDTVNRNESGVPLFKDLPYVGGLFSSDSVSVDRTELVILITAYVLRNQADRDAFVERFTRDIDETLSKDNLITLRPRYF